METVPKNEHMDTENFVSVESIKQENVPSITTIVEVDCHEEIEIQIKQEPAEINSDDESQGSKEDIYPSHRECVKVEPIDYGIDNSDISARQNEEEDTNDLDDSEINDDPTSEENPLGPETGKSGEKELPTPVGSSEKVEYYDYDYDVMKMIKIYTQNDEEWMDEHKEYLEQKKHMQFLCTYCGLGFVFKNAYADHMKIHEPDPDKFECTLCHAWHKSPQALNKHRLRHYRRYRCLPCGTLFRDKDSAACHVTRMHAQRVFACKKCDKTFSRPRYLKQHMEQYHDRPETIECPICQKVFHTKDALRIHVKNHNRRKQTISVSCPICSKVYKTKRGLKQHLGRHEKVASCNLCGEVFEDRVTLRKHYNRIHNQLYMNNSTEVTCPHCSRKCGAKDMLKKHIERMHTGRIKKFQCDDCKRMFMTKVELRSHIVWVHMPAGQRGGHTCNCGRLFRTPSLLAKHVNTYHQGQQPARDYRCDVCGKAFMEKQTLNRHMSVHTDEKHPCTECDLTFKTKGYVKVHYKLVHQNMSWAQIKAEKRLNGKKIRSKNIVEPRNEDENESHADSADFQNSGDDNNIFLYENGESIELVDVIIKEELQPEV